jgi:hypothetical protein
LRYTYWFVFPIYLLGNSPIFQIHIKPLVGLCGNKICRSILGLGMSVEKDFLSLNMACVYLLPNTFILFGFLIFWLWVYPMKFITNTLRVH